MPAIIVIAAAFRIFQLGRESLFFDELYTVWSIRLPLGSLVWEVPASGHPPLYYLVAHFWFMLGNSDAWMRSLAAAAGVATVIFMYFAGKELYSVSAGILAAALSAVSPFLVWESRIATDYSWMIAASALSLYLLVRCARRGGGINWALYAAASVAALFSHYYTVFLIAGEVPLYLLIRDPGKGLKGWLSSQAAIAAALIPWYVYSREGVSEWVFGSYHTPGLADTFRGIYGAPTVLVKGFIELPGGSASGKIIVIAILLAAGLLAFLSRSFRSRLGWKLPLGLSIVALIAMAGPVVYQEMRGDVLNGRYYAAAEPPLLLLFAIVIAAAPRRLRFTGGALVLAVMAAISVYTVESARFSDIRSVLAQVSAQEQPGDWLLAFPVHHFVVGTAHYMSVPPPLAGGSIQLQTPGVAYLGPPGKVWNGYHHDAGSADRMTSPFSGDPLRQRLNADISAAKRVWVIAGDGSNFDYPAGETVYADLSANWREVESRHIAPFILKLYVPRSGAATGS